MLHIAGDVTHFIKHIVRHRHSYHKSLDTLFLPRSPGFGWSTSSDEFKYIYQRIYMSIQLVHQFGHTYFWLFDICYLLFPIRCGVNAREWDRIKSEIDKENFAHRYDINEIFSRMTVIWFHHSKIWAFFLRHTTFFLTFSFFTWKSHWILTIAEDSLRPINMHDCCSLSKKPGKQNIYISKTFATHK